MEDIKERAERLFNECSNTRWFQWDLREQFHIPAAIEMIEKLDLLEPTNFVSGIYYRYLIEHILKVSQVTLSCAAYDKDFFSFLQSIVAEKQYLDDMYSVPFSNFESKLKIMHTKMCGSDYATGISEGEIVRILCDAVISTEHDVYYFYCKNDKKKNVVELVDTNILEYSSFVDLESDIRNDSLDHGFHYVVVDGFNKWCDKSNQSDKLRCIVYIDENMAFLHGDVQYKISSQRMINNTNLTTSNPMTTANVHYPAYSSAGGITVTDGLATIGGSLRVSDGTSTMWLLMLIEMLSLKIVNLPCVETKSTIFSSLYQLDGDLPAISDGMFFIEHISFSEAMKIVGVDNATGNVKSVIEDLVKTFDIDSLLPYEKNHLKLDNNEFYSDLDLIEQGGSGCSRDGAFLSLVTVPVNFFGNQVDSELLINDLIVENLTKIINAKLELHYESKRREDNDFIALKWAKRGHKIEGKVGNWVNDRLPFERGCVTGGRLFCSEDNTHRTLGHILTGKEVYVHVACDLPTIYNVHGGEVVGFYTGDTDYETVLFYPQTVKELCDLLGCRPSSLPVSLQNFKRVHDHDLIAYPWNKFGYRYWMVRLYM